MLSEKQFSREFCHALLYQFLLRIRHSAGGGEEDSAIAYALHNLPAILMAPEWTDKVANEAYRDITGKAHLAGASDWLLQMQNEFAKTAKQGLPLLDRWHGH